MAAVRSQGFELGEGTFGCLTMVISKVKLCAVRLCHFICMMCFSFLPVLECRIFIWKAPSVLWMLSECDKADETACAEIQVLVYPRCECSNAFAAIKGRSVGKHKELCDGICL